MALKLPTSHYIPIYLSAIEPHDKLKSRCDSFADKAMALFES